MRGSPDALTSHEARTAAMPGITSLCGISKRTSAETKSSMGFAAADTGRQAMRLRTRAGKTTVFMESLLVHEGVLRDIESGDGSPQSLAADGHLGCDGLPEILTGVTE